MSALASSCPRGERSFVHYLPPAGRRLAGRILPARACLRPVVALHGLGSTHHDLLDVARRTGAPTLLVDLPGFGASGPFPRGARLAEVAAELAELARAQGFARALWWGCSFGGHLALRVALDRPEQVTGLLLVSSGGLDPAPSPALAHAFREEHLAARSPDRLARELDALVGHPTAATRAFAARRLRAHARGEAGYEGVARAAAAALADDLPRRLDEVRAPAVLVHGEEDPLVPLAHARHAADLLGAPLQVLPGVGHLPWLEDPPAVAEALRSVAQPGARPLAPAGPRRSS